MTHSLRGSQRPERNPLEASLCAFLIVALLPIALGQAPLPGSLEQVPTPFGQMSAWLTLIGSGGVIAGIVWRNRDMGLLIQQASMWFLGIGLLFYGVAIWNASGWGNGRIAIGMCFGIAAGCGARIWQFQVYVRHRHEGTATG